MPRKRQERNVTKARQLRKSMSLPEVLLWKLLRGSPDGVRFRRQHPLGPYVLDFYCAEAKICIEIDGVAHDMGDRAQRDEIRDAWLGEQGVALVRIPTSEVLKSAHDVAAALVRRCREEQ
jgi:very-short-patch-repair endonuclease